MTPEQKAAFIQAQVACANAEVASMTAENMQREHRGESMAYNEEAFLFITNKYLIGHNAVISFFQD